MKQLFLHSAPGAWHRVRQITLAVCTVAALLLLPSRSWSQTLEQAVELDPGGTWLVFKTAHFEIAYQEEDEALARETASTAEEVHAALSQMMGFEPAPPVRIVIAGDYDVSNGYAIPFPYSQVQIFVAPPRPGHVLADTGGNWLRLLLFHELTHTFHLDQVRGLPWLARWIFGRAPGLGTWQTFAPMWLIEGMATYNETKLTGAGRIGSALSEAILRQAALGDRFPSIDQATVFDPEYPGGNIPYLFGGHFVTWVAEKYGQEKLNEWVENYGALPVPFAVDWSAYRVFGKSFSSLWDEWQAEITARAKQQAAAIGERGVRMGTVLVEPNGNVAAPSFLPDGWAHYWHSHPDRLRRHWRVKPGSKPEQVSFNTPASEIVVAPGGALYGTHRIPQGSFALRDAIVKIDWPSLEYQPFVIGGREPTVSPGGGALVFVRRSGIYTHLMKVSPLMEGAEPVALTDPAEGVDYADPTFLDEDTLAVSIYENGLRRLWRVSAKTGARIAPVLPDSFGGNQIQPALSPDGTMLVFASDRGGIYDLYLQDLGSGDTTRLTRVLGAALEPAFTPEGNAVVFVSWEATGRAIRVIEVSEQQALDEGAPEQLQKKPAQFEPEKIPTAEPGEPEDYSPLSTLVPRFWMPTYVQASNDNLIGAWTADEDLLRHWFYSASLYYGLDSAEPRLFTTFGYSRIKAPALLDPLIFGSYSRNLSSFGTAVVGTSKTALQQVDVFELRETARLGLASGSPLSIGLVPIDRDLDPGLSYRVGFEFQRRSALDDSLLLLAAQQGANPAPFTGSNLSGFFARVGLGKTKQSAGAISPELGLELVLETDLYHESLGGDYSSAIFSGDIRGYVPVPFLDHHVIALRVAGGTTQGDRPLTRAFVLGGSLGQGLITLSGTQLALLRGFGESEFAGDHVISGNAEYRMPLLRLRRGPWNMPLFIHVIHLAGFLDAGTAWDDGTAPRSADVAVGAGAELIFDTTLLHYLPTPVRVGVGRGLRVSKQTEYYVRLGRSF